MNCKYYIGVGIHFVVGRLVRSVCQSIKMSTNIDLGILPYSRQIKTVRKMSTSADKLQGGK